MTAASAGRSPGEEPWLVLASCDSQASWTQGLPCMRSGRARAMRLHRWDWVASSTADGLRSNGRWRGWWQPWRRFSRVFGNNGSRAGRARGAVLRNWGTSCEKRARPSRDNAQNEQLDQLGYVRIAKKRSTNWSLHAMRGCDGNATCRAMAGLRDQMTLVNFLLRKGTRASLSAGHKRMPAGLEMEGSRGVRLSPFPRKSFFPSTLDRAAPTQIGRRPRAGSAGFKKP
jgi:hypothetical protein